MIRAMAIGAAVCALAAAALGQGLASFQTISLGSNLSGVDVIPTSVSADGGVVVATSDTLTPYARAFQWRPGVGGLELPGIVGLAGVNATGISGDGTITVGWCGPRAGGSHACRWINGALEDLGLAPGGLAARAYAISEDGSVIVGVAGTFPTQIAFRWTEQGGYQLLPIPDGETRARATAVTADGSEIFGDSACDDSYPSPPNCSSEFLVWPSPTQGARICTPQGYCASALLGVSGDGRTVVGRGLIMTDGNWTYVSDTEFFAVSGDGNIAVGTAYDPDGDYFLPQVWRRDCGSEVGLVDELQQLGLDLGNWEPEFMLATAISADGKTIAGFGQVSVDPDDFASATFVAYLGDSVTQCPIPGEPGGNSTVFTGLGRPPGADHSSATGINADGSVVVGDVGSTLHNHTFRWTRPVGGTDGMVQLSTLPIGGEDTEVVGVSADGATIAGTSASHSCRWTGGGAGSVTSLGTAPGGRDQSYAFGISADGGTIVGYVVMNSGTDLAYRWTSQTGMVTLGTLPGGAVSFANAVNADGSVVVGSSETTPTDGMHAFRWTSAGGMMEDLGVFAAQLPSSEALGVSPDGQTVVGDSYLGIEPTAFRWTPSEGMVSLGTPPGSYQSWGLAANMDGSIVVGTANSMTGGSLACLWTSALGMVDLNVYLPALGADLTGWTLRAASAITADGHFIAGLGTHNGFSEAYVASLVRCGSADFNCDGDTGTDADIEAFFACLAGDCPALPCASTADFNGDGDVGTDADIESFFRVLAGGAC